MPIDFESLKKFKDLDLSKYDEEKAGQVLRVWINPSRRVWADFADTNTPLEERTFKLYSEVWDISEDDVSTLFNLAEAQMWNWLTVESMALVSEHTDKRKKVEKD